MTKFNVLVVDDANFIREFTRRGLTSSIPNVVVLEAVNGRHAQDILAKKPVDIVLCDWEMPEVDGHELLSWIRSDDRFHNLPFIMVTSRGEKSYVVSAVRAGIDGYIVKPFTIDILVSKIHETLARRGRTIASETKAISTAHPFSESVAILTNSYKKNDKETYEVKETSEVEDRGSRNLLSRVSAQLRYSSRVVRCIVQRLDLGGSVVIIPQEESSPAIMDQVVLALTLDSPTLHVKDINAVVNAIDAIESRNETRFKRLTLRFVDEDPKKQAALSRLITSV
ncbi:two-component system, chemotaxis family, chemotaxis protein CheY [Gammaproteobacteria bacterium]